MHKSKSFHSERDEEGEGKMEGGKRLGD